MSRSSNHSPTEPDLNLPGPSAAERVKFPAHRTFSQRHGYKPRPEPMRLEYLSDNLRRDVWDEIYYYLHGMTCKNNYGHRKFSIIGQDIVKRIRGEIQKLPKTDIEADFDQTRAILREIILNGGFNLALDCLEIIINESLVSIKSFKLFDLPEDTNVLYQVTLTFTQIVASLFDKYDAAYYLDTSQQPYYFFPRASKEAGEAIGKAIEAVHSGKMDGAGSCAWRR